MKRFLWFAIFPLFLPSYVTACQYVTVRDACFTEKRDMHRLCVIARKDDPEGQRIHTELRRWLHDEGTGFNAELFYESPDDPDVKWQNYGMPYAPPSSPVTVFSGYHELGNRKFYIRHWEPGPKLEDLAELLTSPFREKIRAELLSKMAVFLYVPGTENGQARQIVDEAARRWSEKEKQGVSVLQVDRSDPAERILLSFMAIRDPGPEWTAVIFGRGKMMPPVVGEDITEAELDRQLETLVGECTCLRAAASFGVDLPMIWDATQDAQIVPLRSPEDALLAGAGAPADPPPSSNMTPVSVLYTLVALFSVVLLTSLAILLIRIRSIR